MLMQGLAVEIETEEPAFDPEVATLFDFLLDSPQFDFMYVLPYSEHYGLVNVAYVTPYATSVKKSTCEAAVETYVRERLGCERFTITKRCYGRIPLASNFPERRPGRRVVPIGMRSGIIKASTSYAFTRILEDSQRIVRALADTGQPYYKNDRPWFYRGSDKATSRVFHGTPKLAQELMFTMFTPANGDLALAFLDEKNSLSQNLELFKAIPPRAIARFLGRLVGASLRG
jgi:lycopene beta-cyclase